MKSIRGHSDAGSDTLTLTRIAEFVELVVALHTSLTVFHYHHTQLHLLFMQMALIIRAA